MRGGDADAAICCCARDAPPADSPPPLFCSPSFHCWRTMRRLRPPPILHRDAMRQRKDKISPVTSTPASPPPVHHNCLHVELHRTSSYPPFTMFPECRCKRCHAHHTYHRYQTMFLSMLRCPSGDMRTAGSGGNVYPHYSLNSGAVRPVRRQRNVAE